MYTPFTNSLSLCQFLNIVYLNKKIKCLQVKLKGEKATPKIIFHKALISMRVVLRNQVEQVKLTQYGKTIPPNNQEMPTKLQKEEYIMQIGQEL